MIGRGGIWLVATVALWLVALGTKETAVVLPAVVLVYDRWILTGDGSTQGARHRLLWLHGPLFGLAAVVTSIRLIVFVFVEQGGSVDFQWPLAWVEVDVVRRYLQMLIAPVGQSIFHPVAPIGGLLQARALIDISVLAVCVWLIWTQRHARPFLSFGLVWFLVFLVPSSVLVMLDRGEAMAEHRIYLASCGAFIVAGALADRVWTLMAAAQRVTRAILVAGFIAVLATLGGRTLLRNALFGHPVIVWLDAAELAPNDWLPHRVLGEELHRAGDHAQAIGAFTRAIELAPGEVSVYGKLGVCLTEQGDLRAAEAAFTKMRGLDAQSPEASNGLATLALLRGNLEAAKRGYLETLALDAANVAARRGLAVIAEAPGGNPVDALRWCQEIKRIDPDAAGIDDCIKRNAAKIGGGRDDGR